MGKPEISLRGSRLAPRRFGRAIAIAAFGLALVASNVSAAVDYRLLKDIKSGSGSSSPFWFTGMPGYVLFLADDGTTLHHGAELWRTDGTRVNTKLVKDINPGAAPSIPPDTEMIRLNNLALFTASDGTHGAELWKTDGTTQHTVMVKDAYPEAGTADPDKGSDPAYLRNVGGLLMFEARDATHGYSLWRSDGTVNGTRMVKDMTPGPGNFGFSGDAVMGNHFFVLGDDGVHGKEMWQSDGTTNGTFPIDIHPGSTGSDPSWWAAANGAFYIAADDGTHGSEPWIVTP